MLNQIVGPTHSEVVFGDIPLKGKDFIGNDF